MLIKFVSSKEIEALVADLVESVKQHKFGVLADHNVKDTLNSKGVEFAPQCRIIEVCNPHQAKKVLDANIDIATALPCRIAVFKESGRTVLATIKPTALLSMFPNPELLQTAQEVESAIISIMKDAA